MGGSYLDRRENHINSANIKSYKIEAIARCIMPYILSFCKSDEGQREFAEWKAQRDAEQAQKGKEDKIN